jgi:hypothetical protein
MYCMSTVIYLARLEVMLLAALVVLKQPLQVLYEHCHTWLGLR